jgi:hypothetical protein
MGKKASGVFWEHPRRMHTLEYSNTGAHMQPPSLTRVASEDMQIVAKSQYSFDFWLF